MSCLKCSMISKVLVFAEECQAWNYLPVSFIDWLIAAQYLFCAAEDEALVDTLHTECLCSSGKLHRHDCISCCNSYGSYPDLSSTFENLAVRRFLSQRGTQNICMPFSPFLEGGIDLLREVFWIKSQDFGKATCRKSIFGDTIAQKIL